MRGRVKGRMVLYGREKEKTRESRGLLMSVKLKESPSQVTYEDTGKKRMLRR